MLAEAAFEISTFVLTVFVLPVVVAALWCLLVDPHE